MIKRSSLNKQDYEAATLEEINKVRNDERLPKGNREIAADWLEKHKAKLDEGRGSVKERKENAHKTYGTIQHLSGLIRNLCLWFDDFNKIKKDTLQQFKLDFYELKGAKRELRTIKGKKTTNQRDYMTKLIRSDFFRYHLKLNDIVDEVFNAKISENKTQVEFITLDDLKLMVKKAPKEYQKLALYILFSTGMRIGTFLNMKKKDFEIKYNNKTKIHYYICHIKKEYLKGTNPDPTDLPIIIPECNDLLKDYLSGLKNEDDFICPVGYNGLRLLLDKVIHESKVRTKPEGIKPTIHILRKSAAMHLLNQGYTSDQVKSFLSHKPSSTVIDKYVNYRGLKYEPEVTRVQTDELLGLQKTIKDNEIQMTSMQRQIDLLQKQMVKFIAKQSSKEELKENIRRREK